MPWVWILLCYEGTLEAFQMTSVLSEDEPFGVISPPLPQYYLGSLAALIKVRQALV